MSGNAKGGRGGATIVIRREESGEASHHGGAWKVAYADFVTAMMAFFLLMWLLNATTEEQRRGLADYFAPTSLLARSVSGSGQPFGGQTPNDSGNVTSTSGVTTIEPGRLPAVMDIEEDDTDTPAQPMPRRDGPPGQEDAEAPRLSVPIPEAQQAPAEASAAMTEAALRRELARHERESFEQAADQIHQAVAADPGLADLARQMLVEQTPEGLRIQLIDADRQPMFALGGAAPNDRARVLLARVAQATARLPNPIAIAGHTDATPFRGGGERSNWDLSAERANVTRRLLVEAGLPEGRVRSVSGHAERDLLLPETPNAAANRRVSITVLRLNPDAAP